MNELNLANVLSDKEFRALTRKPQPASKRHLKTIRLVSPKYDFEMPLPLGNRKKLYDGGYQRAPKVRKTK
jgi:hypothetical protein